MGEDESPICLKAWKGPLIFFLFFFNGIMVGSVLAYLASGASSIPRKDITNQ